MFFCGGCNGDGVGVVLAVAVAVGVGVPSYPRIIAPFVFFLFPRFYACHALFAQFIPCRSGIWVASASRPFLFYMDFFEGEDFSVFRNLR